MHALRVSLDRVCSDTIDCHRRPQSLILRLIRTRSCCCHALCEPHLRADTKMVTGVGWTPSNELYSVSDDKSILKWGLDGESESRLVDNLDVFVTDMKWLTAVRGGNVTAEVFVIGCSDGTFRIYNNIGRLDKTEKAHKSVHTTTHCAHAHSSPLSSRAC
jgi:WD40 repeat protein